MGKLRRAKSSKEPRSNELYVVVNYDENMRIISFDYSLVDGTQKIHNVGSLQYGETTDPMFIVRLLADSTTSYCVIHGLRDFLTLYVPSIHKTIYQFLEIAERPNPVTSNSAGKTFPLSKEAWTQATAYVRITDYNNPTVHKLVVDSNNLFKGRKYAGSNSSWELACDFNFILNHLCYRYPLSMGSLTDELYMRRYAPYHPERPTRGVIQEVSQLLGLTQKTQNKWNRSELEKFYSTHSAYEKIPKHHGVIFIPDDVHREFDKMSYFGGRNEIYYQGIVQEATSYDVNGLYAMMMRDKLYPYNLVRHIKTSRSRTECKYGGVRYNDLYDSITDKGLLATANVRLNIPKMNIPPFPVRINKRQLGNVIDTADELTIYPTGRFETYLSTPELLLAYENDWIECVFGYNIYEAKNYFEEFVEDLNVFKEMAQHEDVCDLYGVSPKMLKSLGKFSIILLFGKLGQKSYDIDDMTDICVSEDTKNTYAIFKNERNLESLVKAARQNKFVYRTSKLDNNSHPAVASHVTSYGRVFMWRKMQELPPDSLLYIDTDGIVVRGNKEEYKDIFEIGEHLGQWKIEAEGKAHFWSQKNYYVGSKSVNKNVDNSVNWGEDWDAGIGQSYLPPQYKNFKTEKGACYQKFTETRSTEINSRIPTIRNTTDNTTDDEDLFKNINPFYTNHVSGQTFSYDLDLILVKEYESNIHVMPQANNMVSNLCNLAIEKPKKDNFFEMDDFDPESYNFESANKPTQTKSKVEDDSFFELDDFDPDMFEEKKTSQIKNSNFFDF